MAEGATKGNGPRIFVAGSASGWNLGDNALLERNMEMIRDRVPDVTFVLPTYSMASTGRAFPHLPVAVVSAGRLRFCTPTVLRQMLRADAIITCGGIFFDHSLFRITENFIVSLAPALILCCRRRIPVVGFNVGVQPPATKIGRAFMRKALDCHDHIFLRDGGDAQILADIGIRTPATVGADSAIRGRTAPIEAAHMCLGWTEPPSRPLIGVNVTRFLERSRRAAGLPVSREELVRLIGEALRAVIRQTGTSVALIPTERWDYSFLEEVGRWLRWPSRCFVARSWDYQTTRTIIGLCEFLVGSRLHSLIFACGMGVPFAGIPYQPKVAGFLRTVGLPSECLIDDWWQGPDELARGIIRAYEVRHTVGPAIERFARGADQKAQQAADWLVGRLGERPAQGD